MARGILSGTSSYSVDSATNNNEILNIKYFKNKKGNGKYNLIYININSIRNKLFDLEAQINSFNSTNSKIHFIALTETRIFDHDSTYFNLENYNVFFCNRPDGDGGCALFIDNMFNCELVESYCRHNVNILTVNIIDINLHITVFLQATPCGL